MITPNNLYDEILSTIWFPIYRVLIIVFGFPPLYVILQLEKELSLTDQTKTYFNDTIWRGEADRIIERTQERIKTVAISNPKLRYLAQHYSGEPWSLRPVPEKINICQSWITQTAFRFFVQFNWLPSS